jgi:hypothetical protein
MMAIVVTVEGTRDSILFVKIDGKEFSNPDKINPVEELDQIKNLVNGNLNAVKFRYFDDDVSAEIRFRISKLLAYYVLKSDNTFKVRVTNDESLQNH